MTGQPQKLSSANVTKLGATQAGDLFLVERSNVTYGITSENLNLIQPSYENRAAFVTAVSGGLTVEDGAHIFTDGLCYISVSGATTIADLPGWVPGFWVYPNHYTTNASPGTTDMLAAINAAKAYSDDVYLRDEEYYISDVLPITQNGVRILGSSKGGGAQITGNSALTSPVVIIGKSNPAVDGRITGVEMRNLIVAGGSNASRTRALVEIQRGERCALDNVRISGGYSGVSIQGGQFNSITNHIHSSGGSSTVVAGTAAIQVREYDLGGSTYEQAFTINISDFYLSAGGNNGTAYPLDVTSSDGLQIVNGYCGRAGAALIKLGPTVTDNVGSLTLTNVYFDGVNTTNGAPKGLYIPSTASAGDISARFNNCQIGQCTGDLLDVNNANLKSLEFIGCTLGNSGSGNIGSVTGATAQSKLTMIGCQFRNAGPLAVTTMQTVTITDSDFDDISGANCVALSGTISNRHYDNLTYRNGSVKLADTSTGGDNEPTAHWYETGTWTPVVADAASGGGTATGTFGGRYWRTGKTVRVSFSLTNIGTAGMTGGNEIFIRGLPYASLNSTPVRATSPVSLHTVTFTGADPFLYIGPGDDYMQLRQNVTGAAPTELTVAALSSGVSDAFGSIEYEIA